MRDARTIQDDENTLVVISPMQSGPVKVSFFGGLAIGRINEPLRTSDATLLVASLEDLLVTKLKAIMDRAEAKDYRDISAMLTAGISLEKALGAFAKMYRKDPGLLQGWRFAFASQGRSGYSAEGERSCVRNS
jgi:hypothetical protein